MKIVTWGTSLPSSHPIHEETHTATEIIHIFFMAFNIQAEVFTHSASSSYYWLPEYWVTESSVQK